MPGICSERVLCLQFHRKPFATAWASLRLLEVAFLVTLIITGVFVEYIHNIQRISVQLPYEAGCTFRASFTFFQMKKPGKPWTSWDMRCPKSKDLGLTWKTLTEQEIESDLWIWVLIIFSKHNYSTAVVSNIFRVDQ